MEQPSLTLSLHTLFFFLGEGSVLCSYLGGGGILGLGDFSVNVAIFFGFVFNGNLGESETRRDSLGNAGHRVTSYFLIILGFLES